MIRTRFAPSPSGYLHIGNIRTALWNYLYATKHSGEFIVRIEDTDQQRSDNVYAESVTHHLQQLGITYSQCVWQTEQTHTHDACMQQLQAQGNIYPCFCNKERLEQVRKQQIKQNKPPRYDRHCRGLSADERARLLAANTAYVWRFAVPTSGQVVLQDAIRNKEITFVCERIEDFVLKRADGNYTFLFTNIVDDLTSHMSHVIRGEDHISNTPKQLLICQALQKPAPVYIHCPLIVGDDNKPLSKRDGVFDVSSLLKQGYLPLAVCNYLARIGCTYASDEVYDMTNLAHAFEHSCISLSATRFAPQQLDDWQKRTLNQLSQPDWCSWAMQALDAGTQAALGNTALFARWARDNCVHFADVKKWAHALVCGTCDQTALDALDAATAMHILQTAITMTDTTDWQQLVQQLQQQATHKGKKLFMPLRIALSGHTSGPPLDGLWSMLSVEERQKRFEQTTAKLVDVRQ